MSNRSLGLQLWYGSVSLGFVGGVRIAIRNWCISIAYIHSLAWLMVSIGVVSPTCRKLDTLQRR